jgi:hypothetical protein
MIVCEANFGLLLIKTLVHTSPKNFLVVNIYIWCVLYIYYFVPNYCFLYLTVKLLIFKGLRFILYFETFLFFN